MINAFTTGYERLSTWADLLDQINVYPVADADTGRNLMISLAPLRNMQPNDDSVAHQLLLAATGNSGNIANAFLSEFVAANKTGKFIEASRRGRDRAWQAIVDPQPGTILSLLDALVEGLEKSGVDNNETLYSALIPDLQVTVHDTVNGLATLTAAGVVDAGALGLYIFLEGFFAQLAECLEGVPPVTDTFAGKMSVATTFEPSAEEGFCVDTVIRTDGAANSALDELSKVGESIVVNRESKSIKIHLHTHNRAEVRKTLESLGHVEQWSAEALDSSTIPESSLFTNQKIRIVTDAAGSITRHLARDVGITLLDSYIVEGNRSLPETVVSPDALYHSMQKGVRVTTAQASSFERHQRYQSILDRYPAALYLCVGSVYTGNYDTVMAWRKKNDPQSRFQVIDTGSASGRLGILALTVAEYANDGHEPDEVITFAQAAQQKCEEYLVLDRLKYLVAGGRISKSKGFMGDLLHMKPIISPTSEGAVKAGTARNQAQQVDFAMEKIEVAAQKNDHLALMLEYSNNRPWVEETVLTMIKESHPTARIMLMPLSLTSGVHMGPGTWGVALMPGTIPPK